MARRECLADHAAQGQSCEMNATDVQMVEDRQHIIGEIRDHVRVARHIRSAMAARVGPDAAEFGRELVDDGIPHAMGRAERIREDDGRGLGRPLAHEE